MRTTHTEIVCHYKIIQITFCHDSRRALVAPLCSGEKFLHLFTAGAEEIKIAIYMMNGGDAVVRLKAPMSGNCGTLMEILKFWTKILFYES